MMFIIIVLICFLVQSTIVYGLHTGPFNALNWIIDDENSNNNEVLYHSSKVSESPKVTFVVALALRNGEELKSEFLEISNPKSNSYGKYSSVDDIQMKYSPLMDDINSVTEHFQQISVDTNIECNIKGDMLRITSSIMNIEQFFNTKLALHKHKTNRNPHQPRYPHEYPHARQTQQ